MGVAIVKRPELVEKRVILDSETIFCSVAILALAFAVLSLFVLVFDLFVDGSQRMTFDFLSNPPSRFPLKAGIYPALMGSLWLMVITALVSIPIGVGAAVYLEEYAVKNWITRIIELNITNLAAVPSIIYGLLGLQLFVRILNFERSVLAGGLTLALLVLPIIIIVSREAIRAVPRSYREGAMALGATKWQTITSQVLPAALPGILTGCILALSRAIGETAPLITMGALTYVAFAPDGLFSAFTAIPIQSFNWVSRPQEEFHANAAAAICLLLFILLLMNSGAIFLRHRLQKRLA